MFHSLQEFTASLPELLQWLGVVLISMIPLVESYFGSTIGVLAGVNPFVAVAAAIAGNVVSMLVVVLGTHRVRSKITANRAPQSLSPRREKLRDRLDRYGVPGVSLLGQLFLPSQVTSAAMVSFGASKNAVILWQIVSIILWGVLFGVLTTLGLAVMR